MFDKSRDYGKFYVVKSSAGDMFYRKYDEAKHYGLPSEVWGYPVFNKADKLGTLPVALFGSREERDAAYPDPEPEPAPVQHASDCAVHNEPAMPAGECDCGAASPAETPAPSASLFKRSKPRKRT